MTTRPRNLFWELAQRFRDHYYPATGRPSGAPVVALRGNIEKRIREKGLGDFKEWAYGKYAEHLGHVTGVAKATEFLESVKELLAEIALTTETG